MLKKESFKDIEKLYNIIDIKDCIISKTDNTIIKSYVYKITPITILNLSKEHQNDIINKYIEFLRQTDMEFKIFIINKKLDIEKYIKENMKTPENNNKALKKIYRLYVENMKQKLVEEKIYITEYYIVISFESNNIKIEDFENNLYKLNDVGCEIEKINNKKTLENYMYQCINKQYN